MSFDNAITVENLSKCYHIYERPRDRLAQMLMRGRRQYFQEFWALRDVSFEVERGETVGIIGRNGSGKSTLLQLICGTLNPTSGNINVNGRIAALLELGTGFSPEFTGRENVHMNCALLGLSIDETNARFDDIAAFADIGNFLDQPVKTYSSGMFVRLAFAVNIMSHPEIMVVDEALAVGDMNFQAKCMTALSRIQEAGSTVLFVSHDIISVRSLCSRSIYLDKGAIKIIGDAPDVTEAYIRDMREEMNAEQRRSSEATSVIETAAAAENVEQNEGASYQNFVRSAEFDSRVATFRYGSGGARITYVDLLDHDNVPVRHVEYAQKVRIKICFESENRIDIACNYYVADEKRNLVVGADPLLTGHGLIDAKQGRVYTVIYETALPLHEGNYSIQVQLTHPVVHDKTAEFLDVVDNAVIFSMSRREGARLWTQAYVPNRIEVLER